MVSSHHDETESLLIDPEHPSAADDMEANNITTNVHKDHPDAPLGSSSENVLPKINDNTEDSNNQNSGDRSNAQLEIAEDGSPGNSGTATPRFMQDERLGKRLEWIPFPVRRVCIKAARWSHGPPNPQPYRIRPFFPIIQEYPLRLVERFLPGLRRRMWLVSIYIAIWIVAFVLVKKAGTLSTEIAGWGPPQDIGCGAAYWSAGNSCGLDGNDCRPFNGSGFPFRCPGNCNSYRVLNPHAVGDQELIYRTLVIGGPSNDMHHEATYRGDSYVCSAAIHAGIISSQTGGCGVVEVIGQRDNFIGSERNGIISVGFDSYFPLSFRFVPDSDCSAQDMRWPLLIISAIFTGILSLLTSSPALFFFSNFIGIFWTIGMAIDSPTHRSVAALFSILLGRFLPAMFCAWVIYDKMGVRRTLKNLTAQIEKTILWLGPCWVGAMDNYTLSRIIPIQRLNAHDLDQQPGAKAALAIIIIILVTIFVSQVWFLRQEGRLLKYLKLYGLFVFAIFISLLLPGLNLRIHHYILALLLLPGTSIQTRPSLIYQGLLIGLFINGITRWGFDPVLQTPAALQGDAHKGTSLPLIYSPAINMANNTHPTSDITFSWKLPTEAYVDGISVLVNDVERFRSYFDDAVGRQDVFTWSREADLDMPEYFRFAFMDGSKSGDYSKAGTWTAEGEWIDMAPGPSKVKGRSLDIQNRLKARR